jgi:tRNA-splicing ligase RtcB (3'-phosphate/5'-hydroxy nucleic acid ligase)
MEEEYKKKSNHEYEIPKSGKMLVPATIYASDSLFEAMKQDVSLKQIKNVAALPGIQKKAIAMSDAHQGYGFPIGGVAAFDSETGIITPGGIGFDINCGVRLLATNLTRDQVQDKLQEVIDLIYDRVPVGVGSESKIRLTHEELDKVLENGVDWAIEQGIGNKEDKANCESYGKMSGADATKVSPRAKKRGKNQLGTLGAGNHFLEIQAVDEIYDKEIAEKFGITKKDQVLIMIHCGSRGLGHQVCSDYIRKMEDTFPEIVAKLPEKDLIYAPISSEMAQDYFKGMSAAANYAWANRHIIAHNIRKVFERIFPKSEVKTVYDVAHNIAKKEVHEGKELMVHRKGATRAFPAGHKENPAHYLETGHPVIIPGSMGTSSYVLVGTEKAMTETFGSTAHGAGRLMSRSAARKTIDGIEVKAKLNEKHIMVKNPNTKGLADEAPEVYKDIDEVIKVTVDAGICKKVVRLVPLGVIKG